VNVKWAMKIDRAVGLPLGLALRAIDQLRPRSPRPCAPLEPPKEILVLKCLGFGSIVQMAPMLCTLREAYPTARITLLTFEQNSGLASLLPAVDVVETIEFRRGLLRFLLDTARQCLRLRARNPELIIDAEFFSYYVAFLTWLVARRGAVSIGYFNNRRSKDWIFTHAIAIDLSEHITEAFQKALAPLQLETPPRTLAACGFRVPEQAKASLRAKLPVDPADTVVVNINASDLCLNRRWPMAHFQELLRSLAVLEEFKGKVFVLIGGPEDVAYVQACAQGLTDLPALCSLAGNTSLDELAALLSGAALFIGNDSGPLHLAEAYGLRSISFFGPETPHLYGPRGGEHRVFYTRPHCSPCLNVFYSKENNCRDNICMKRIAPDTVLGEARQMMGRASAE